MKTIIQGNDVIFKINVNKKLKNSISPVVLNSLYNLNIKIICGRCKIPINTNIINNVLEIKIKGNQTKIGLYSLVLSYNDGIDIEYTKPNIMNVVEYGKFNTINTVLNFSINIEYNEDS